ncbi:MAG: DUF302 domain-containing protein [Ruegeria sp.]
MKQILVSLALILGASAVTAQDMVSYTTSESFDDVTFGVESAILDRGLRIEHVAHVGEMLERTRADVGSDKVLFSNANVYSFCSASLSRKVMEADPMNIMFCPYDVFVAELADRPGEVIVGYRGYPEGPMQEVQALLDEIAREAAGE